MTKPRKTSDAILGAICFVVIVLGWAAVLYLAHSQKTTRGCGCSDMMCEGVK